MSTLQVQPQSGQGSRSPNPQSGRLSVDHGDELDPVLLIAGLGGAAAELVVAVAGGGGDGAWGSWVPTRWRVEGDEMELRARAGGRADVAAKSATTVSSTAGAADLEYWIGGGHGERGGAATTVWRRADTWGGTGVNRVARLRCETEPDPSKLL
jgi:hypothetical protein